MTEVNESHARDVVQKTLKKRKRSFKCLSCGLEAHRDAVGCVNMGLAREGGAVKGAVASPHASA